MLYNVTCITIIFKEYFKLNDFYIDYLYVQDNCHIDSENNSAHLNIFDLKNEIMKIINRECVVSIYILNLKKEYCFI